MPGAFSKEQKLRRFLKAKRGCAKRDVEGTVWGQHIWSRAGEGPRSLSRAPGHCAWWGGPPSSVPRFPA